MEPVPEDTPPEPQMTSPLRSHRFGHRAEGPFPPGFRQNTGDASESRPVTKTDLRAYAVLGFASTALQRFGITIGDGVTIQIPLVVLMGTVLWHVVRSRHISATGTLLYFLLAGSTALSTLQGSTQSITSLLLLAGSFLVLIVVDHGTVGKSYMRGVLGAVGLGASLSVVQWALQSVGIAFWDPLRSAPPEILVPGFNTYYELTYAGGVAGEFKPNGVIFLEPSLLSLYCGLAIVAALAGFADATSPRGQRRLLAFLAVSIAGLAASASASGLLVVGVGALGLLGRIPALLGRIGAILVAGLLIASQTGALDALINKALEGVGGYTSTSLRLTRPYELLSPVWMDQPLLGDGAGATYDAIAMLGMQGLQATTPIRILGDFGIAGMVVLVSATWFAMTRSGAPWAVRLATLSMWTLPADMLLSANLIALVFFAVPLWPRSPSGQQAQPIAEPKTGKEVMHAIATPSSDSKDDRLLHARLSGTHQGRVRRGPR